MKRAIGVALVLVVVAALLAAAFLWKPAPQPQPAPSPSASPSPSPSSAVVAGNEVPMPEPVKAVMASMAQFAGPRVFSYSLVPSADATPLPLLVLKGPADEFAATLDGGKLAFYRSQKGKTWKLDEEPEVAAGGSTLRVLYSLPWVLLELDGQRCAMPVTVRELDTLWRDSNLGTATPLADTAFADAFSRWEGSGDWEIQSGRFELSFTDFADRSMNPGYLSAQAGTGVAARVEEEHAAARTAEPRVGFGILAMPHPQGLLVERISPNSPASRAGIDENDIITHIDNRNASPQLLEAIERVQGRATAVSWLHEGRKLTATVTPDLYRWGAVVAVRNIEPYNIAKLCRAVNLDQFTAGSFIEVNMRLVGEGVTGGIAWGVTDRSELRLYPRRESIGTPPGWYFEFVRGGNSVTSGLVGGAFPDPGAWFTLTVKLYSPTEQEVLIDGDSIGKLSFAGPVAGGVALLALGDGRVDFDDFRRGSNGGYLEQWRTERRTPGFEFDERMAPSASVSPGTLNKKGYWLDDGPFADAEVFVTGLTGFKASLWSFDRDQEGLLLAHDTGSSKLILLHKGKQLAQFEGISDRVKAGVEIVRRGGSITVRVDGSTAGSIAVPEGLESGWFGLVSDKAPPNGSFRVTAPNLFLDDFTRAPANWAVRSGVWTITTRWSCDPRWSWFGGWSDSRALITSKVMAQGDMSLDLHIAPSMISHNAPWEKRAGFLIGLTDWHNDPAGGYLVSLGEDGDRRTVLYRRGVEVAAFEGRAFKDTSFMRDDTPVHAWYRVQLSVIAGRVSFKLDGRELLKFADPVPIREGRAVVGAVANGVLIARARLHGDALVPGLGAAGVKAEPVAGFSPVVGGAVSCVTSIPDGFRVEGLSGEGPCDMVKQGTPLPLEANPHISFLLARKNADVNFYFRCEGIDFRIDLCGTENQAGDAEAVAHLVVEPDGSAHRVEVDLKGALSRYFPGNSKLLLTDLRFGMPRSSAPVAPAKTGGLYSVTVFRLAPYSANNAPPSVLSVTAPYSQAGNGEVLLVSILDPSSGGLLANKAVLTLNGQAVPIDGVRARYDRVFRRFEVFMDRLGLPAGEYELGIDDLSTSAGGRLRNWKGSFSFSADDDQFAPDAVFTGSLIRHSFDEPPMGAYPAPNAIEVLLSNFPLPLKMGEFGAGMVTRYDGAYRGTGYLRVFNRANGGPFALGLVDRPIDLMACPLFTAALRMDRPLPLELVIKSEHWVRSVPLPRELGGTSGNWWELNVNLRPYLEPGVPVQFVGLVSSGWQGIPLGEHYDIDEVRFNRVVASSRFPLVKASDCSGPVKVFAGLGSEPQTQWEAMELTGIRNGFLDLRWAAEDAKGNRTPSLRDPVLVDNSAPTVATLERRGDVLHFQLSDDFGVLPSTVTVQLDSGLSYNLRNGLTMGRDGFWSLVLPDDRATGLTIYASDYAGNSLSHRTEVEGEPEIEDPFEDEEHDPIDEQP